METRCDKEYADLIGKFELRQVALVLDEGKALDGATAEVVTELRSKGGYRGVPVPWQALEKRNGETDRQRHAGPRSDHADHRSDFRRLRRCPHGRVA